MSEKKPTMELLWGPACADQYWIMMPRIAITLMKKLKVSPAAFEVLVEIMSYIRTNENPRPISSYIAAQLGITTSAVNKQIDILKEKGLIDWDYPPAKTNRGRRQYTFAPLHDQLAKFRKACSGTNEESEDTAELEDLYVPPKKLSRKRTVVPEVGLKTATGTQTSLKPPESIDVTESMIYISKRNEVSDYDLKLSDNLREYSNRGHTGYVWEFAIEEGTEFVLTDKSVVRLIDGNFVKVQ